MKALFALFCFFLINILIFNIAYGAETYERNGNIYFKRDNYTLQLTTQGKDYNPLISPNGKYIVFLRDTTIPYNLYIGDGNGYHNQIWVVDIANRKESLLVNFQENSKPEKNLAMFSDLKFSLDSRFLYFVCDGWATSGALHRFDFKNNLEEFFTDVVIYRIFDPDKCRKLPRVDKDFIQKYYKDHLIIWQHRHYAMIGGSYDRPYLFSPNKENLGLVSRITLCEGCSFDDILCKESDIWWN